MTTISFIGDEKYMKLPTVSVIVPVYNAQAAIEKCVMSILENNYRALEVILVNDGSVDGSGLICDQLACRDSRIKVIHKLNAVSRSWNRLV